MKYVVPKWLSIMGDWGIVATHQGWNAASCNGGWGGGDGSIGFGLSMVAVCCGAFCLLPVPLEIILFSA